MACPRIEVADSSAGVAREERLAQNETIFRMVNERIASHEPDRELDARHDFVCECSSADCFERITLTRA